jgi:hypothetical protein
MDMINKKQDLAVYANELNGTQVPVVVEATPLDPL